jgi:3-methyladenine DNA glycosylase AlkD
MPRERPSLDPLLARLRAELRALADPARAPQMQAYMRSSMPYLGVPTPLRRAACKRVFAELPLADAAAWRRQVLALWRGAQFREERYAALDLTGVRAARPFQDLGALPMYEELIVTGAWWDYVDELASHRLGALLRRHPAEMRAAMLAWSRSDDLWKRRAAILCQLGFKRETDTALLYACIEPALGSREFFLRKAIGWALRQYAWTDPQEVARYVRAQGERLSPLSRREALKHVPGEGQPRRRSRSATRGR